MESNAKTISNVYGLFELDGYGGNMTWLGNWASRDEAIEGMRYREGHMTEPGVLMVLPIVAFAGETA